MKLELETLADCPVCGDARLQPFMRIADFESGTGEYGLVECTGCGAALTSPRPIEAELPRLYAARTTTDFAPDQRGLVGWLRAAAVDAYLRRALDHSAGKLGPTTEVLDYGCGDGALTLGLLRHARARGRTTHVTALDFHPEAPPALAAEVGKHVTYIRHEQWQPGAGRFDAIFLRHVLEHHPDPRRLLGVLRNSLKAGGRMFVEVPNRRSAWAAVFGPYFFGYYVPRHLTHFDVGSLRMVVERSGLRCVELEPGHTPLIGRSIGYRTGWTIGNLGVVGLLGYPVQVVVDVLAGRSSTLRLVATTDDA